MKNQKNIMSEQKSEKKIEQCSRFETWGYLEISVPCNFMMGDDYIGLIKHF